MYNPKRNIAEMRKKSSLYFMVGLSLSLSIALMAFNYTTSEVVNKPRVIENDNFEEEYVVELFTIEKPKAQTPIPNPVLATPVFNDDFLIDDGAVGEDPIIPDEGVDLDVPVLPYNEVVIPENLGGEEFIIVDEMPLFPGGEAAMMKFLSENLRYPEWAVENNVQGKLTIQFVVDEEGYVTNAKIISDKLGFGCDEAALEVINAMPRWKPGKQRSKNVKVRFVVPISFRMK